MIKGELTRSRIITCAAPLFQQKGYAACSMAEIMKATGLKKGGIYRHFPSKEALANAAVRHALEATGSALEAGARRRKEPLKRIKFLLSHYETSSPTAACPGVNSIAGTAGRDLINLVQLAQERWRALFVSAIQDGQESGIFSRVIEAEALAVTFMAATEGASALSHGQQNSRLLKQVHCTLMMLLQKDTL